MSFFKKNEYIIVIIGAIIAVALAIGLPFVTQPSEQLMPKLTLSQLALSAGALFFLSISLYLTIVQVRKSMAKPIIKVAFNESGEQQATLIYKDDEPSGLPSLWLINEGNAIARYFQIDFVIPENIGKPSVSQYLYTKYVSFVKDKGEYILSYTNEGRYTLFVNRPYSDPNMVFWAAIDTKKCIKVYEDSFEIKYRIYGDWAETQEGELRVVCKKHKEVS